MSIAPAMMTGMEMLEWIDSHPDWWIKGEWSDERYAMPLQLTDAGRRAISEREKYDLAPVAGGLVEPGWIATPTPQNQKGRRSMSKPIHTPGPVEVIMEADRHVDGAPFKDYFIVTSGEKNRTIADTYNCDFVLTEEDRHANARLLAAAYNAFDSAARQLGCNAVELAEGMAERGIADLIQAVRAAKEMSDWFMKHSRQAEHAHEELKQPLHETTGWKELADAGYNGLMASYHSQFEEALAKVKGGAT